MDAEKAGLEKIWMPIRKAQYGSLPFVAASTEKILDAIAQTAFNSLAVYGNCCRSTLWAIQTHLRMEASATLRASSVLAGGICGTGETCGAVLGGMIAIGEALGSDDFRDLESYERANANVREFLQKIQERYSSSRCHAIQTSVMGWCCDDPSKAEQWTEAGGPLACAGVCAEASRYAASIILAYQSSLST